MPREAQQTRGGDAPHDPACRTSVEASRDRRFIGLSSRLVEARHAASGRRRSEAVRRWDAARRGKDAQPPRQAPGAGRYTRRQGAGHRL